MATYELPLRDMTTMDRRFVVPTWARSARYGLTVPEHFKIVDGVLGRGARVTVMATDERTVHAWLAHDDDIMHYVYVAPELRRMRIARELVARVFGPKGPAVVTHETPWALASRARLCPYLLAMPKEAA